MKARVARLAGDNGSDEAICRAISVEKIPCSIRKKYNIGIEYRMGAL